MVIPFCGRNRSEIGTLKAEVKSLSGEIGSLRAEMNERFDQNEKDHEAMLKDIKEFVSGGYDLLDKRTTKLENKVFSSA